jgi:hypothetical protein
MTWAQRLKHVFNIDIEVCGRCGGTAKVIVGTPNRCIEDQDTIDRILDHLRQKEQDTPVSGQSGEISRISRVQQDK